MIDLPAIGNIAKNTKNDTAIWLLVSWNVIVYLEGGMFNVCKRQWEWLVIPQLIGLRALNLGKPHLYETSAFFCIQEDKLMLLLDTLASN